MKDVFLETRLRQGYILPKTSTVGIAMVAGPLGRERLRSLAIVCAPGLCRHDHASVPIFFICNDDNDMVGYTWCMAIVKVLFFCALDRWWVVVGGVVLVAQIERLTLDSVQHCHARLRNTQPSATWARALCLSLSLPSGFAWSGSAAELKCAVRQQREMTRGK